MFTILASILGFCSSLLPDIMKYFQDRQDKAHELQIMQIQIEREKLGLAIKEQEIEMQTAAQVMQAAYQMQDTSKIKWIEGLNDLMRPFLTIMIVFDYILVTVLSYKALILTGAIDSAGIITDVLWNDDDRNVFAICISYWFGRTLRNK